MSITQEDRDDLATLAYMLSIGLPKDEAKHAVAAMYDLTEDMAWALIVRGKTLARQGKRRAA